MKNEEENPKAEVSPQSTTVTSTQTSEQSENSKTWSQIAKAGLADRGPVKNPTARIKPVFNSESVGYDRIVITPTHFNSKQFKGYISEKEADTISMAIGLKDLENHHGTSFYRNEDDMLFITFKLKQTMSKDEVANSINKYFWYSKESKVGNLDKISGQVVHPPMGDSGDESGEESLGNHFHGVPTGNLDSTKEVRIDGCNYEISENEIQKWMEQYGEISSDIEEVAIPSKLDGEPVGTGSYVVKIKLKNLIPHILPIGGLKVKCTYIGVKKQCKNCYEYHKSKKSDRELRTKNYTCVKKTYQQYVEMFAENNPRILKSIRDYQIMKRGEKEEDEESNGEYTKETDESNVNDVYYSFNYEKTIQ